MNSFPTPESSPVIIESDVSNKSKDSKNERKKKSPLKNERKKLSKSLSPGTSVNGKRKTLFPKVVLPLFPKITNKVSVHILFMPFFFRGKFPIFSNSIFSLSFPVFFLVNFFLFSLCSFFYCEVIIFHYLLEIIFTFEIRGKKFCYC